MSKQSVRTIVSAIIGVVIALFIFNFFKEIAFGQRNTQSSGISGKIFFSGLKPKDDIPATVLLESRKVGSKEEFEIVKELPAENKYPWKWTDAEDGVRYEIRANFQVNGESVAVSDSLEMTAPAQDENLAIVVDPEYVSARDLAYFVHSSRSSSLQGVVLFNGTVPMGSTVYLYTKAHDETTFTLSQKGIGTKNNSPWSLDSIQEGSRYSIQAKLVTARGDIVGESAVVHATAPESDIQLLIVSHANVADSSSSSSDKNSGDTRPRVKSKISGRVEINGPVSSKSHVSLLWRHPGEKDFQLIRDIPPQDGYRWEWTEPNKGWEYELTACYGEGRDCISAAPHVTVTAPAQNIVLKIDTGLHIDRPGKRPELESCVNVNDSEATARLRIFHRDNMYMYWVTVGDQSGYRNTFNDKISRDSTDDFTVDFRVQRNKDYHARYAVAPCKNCKDDRNYSSFSDELTFRCGDSGGSTVNNDEWKGYYCNSGNYSCELTKDNNAPFNFSNEGLGQCQRSCVRPTQAPTATPTPPPQATATPTPTGTAYQSNAASICLKTGGNLRYVDTTSGREFQACEYSNGSVCEARALSDGTCSQNSVIAYSSAAAQACVSYGGTPSADSPQGVCNFPADVSCSNQDILDKGACN